MAEANADFELRAFPRQDQLVTASSRSCQSAPRLPGAGSPTRSDHRTRPPRKRLMARRSHASGRLSRVCCEICCGIVCVRSCQLDLDPIVAQGFDRRRRLHRQHQRHHADLCAAAMLCRPPHRQLRWLSPSTSSIECSTSCSPTPSASAEKPRQGRGKLTKPASIQHADA